MQKTSSELELAGAKLTLETGALARQATVSVMARHGDTMVLVTIVEGGERKDIDYFPLSVEYVERLYAGGKIKGSRWVKREGRPSDEAILTARLIDRSIRPFFPKEFKKEVQVVVTVLSVDNENEPDILAIIATSAALSASKIPWNGPVSASRIGYAKDPENGKGEYLVNPGDAESDLSDLDLIVTQTKEKTIMLEAGGVEVAEDIVIEAIKRAQVENKRLIEFIEEFAKKVGAKKEEVKQDPKLAEIVAFIEKTYKKQVLDMIPERANKEVDGGTGEELVDEIFAKLKAENPEEEYEKGKVAKAVEKILYKGIRDDIISKGKRPDGRKVDEIREIECEVSILPRTHGSAIFRRGTTQVLSVVTLGSPRMEQLIESAEGEESKRYMHHYSFPPYSVGETGRIGSPSRREIGHGALAERALFGVVPKQERFPYTIRVVSETLSSNGSTSMASVCGSTLALMDAGVPLINPVAGIAMGLMTDGDKYQILTDIIGLEDFSGDMDFKVAGTTVGVTAIQLDVKLDGLTDQQIEEVFVKAKTARLSILEKMIAAIPASRSGVSEYAPKIEVVTIPVEKIGEVIGPGGRVIKNIIATTGATVDVDETGQVAISGTSAEAVQKASEWVKNLIREVQPGEIFDGEVKRILPFGAFVEILPGKEGMVHVSKMSTEFVKDPNDIVEIGKKVKVRVAEIDDQGRINLSMLFGEDADKPREPGSDQGRGGPRGDRPGGPPDMRGPRGPRDPRRDARPPFRDRGPRPERSAGPSDRPARSEHPLSQQLRREKGSPDWRRRDDRRR